MGGLFGGSKPKAPPPPEPMPDADDRQIEAARRRRVALAQQQSGIRSAVLSRPGSKETLGA